MKAIEVRNEYLNFREKVIQYYNALPKGIYKFPSDYWVRYLASSFECLELVKSKRGVYIKAIDEKGQKIKFEITQLTPEQLMYIAQILENDIQDTQKNDIE